MKTVVVVGASPKPERYSHMCLQLLIDLHYNAIPVAPCRDVILGRKVFPTLGTVSGDIHTVTMYVGAERQACMIDELICMKPKRVIFNPGSENPAAYGRLRDAGIDVLEACTLIMLRTGQF